MKLYALQWVGGKSGFAGAKSAGKWIASMLPKDRNVCYVEPFAGMLGVLLQRTKSKKEIVNDLDELVVNWWGVVRDEPHQLANLLQNTPRSRVVYERCMKLMVSPNTDNITRAWSFTVAVSQAYGGKVGAVFGLDLNIDAGNQRNGNSLAGMVNSLKHRIQDVQLECKCACKLVEQISTREHVVAYLDPPYKEACQGIYGVNVDRDRLFAALKEVKGRFAISGYGSEWDQLGWVRSEKRSQSSLAPGDLVIRTEVLWTNYQPDVSQPSLGL